MPISERIKRVEEKKERFVSSELLKSLRVLLNTFEKMVLYTERLDDVQALSRTARRDTKTISREIYERLDGAACEVGLGTPELVNTSHPLAQLWNRWNECNNRVTRLMRKMP